jgi:acetyltransferase-like isoleucine patch superfamily enzyme
VAGTPRTRRLAADLLHRTWRWAETYGAIGPDHRSARRFRCIGAGSAIAFPPGDHLGEDRIVVGAGTLICPFVTLAVGMPLEPVPPPGGPPVITIGDRCMVGRGSSIVARQRVEIADDVTIAPNVYITDHNHTYADVTMPIGRQWLAEQPVSIGPGCWIGSGVVILPGARIGRHVTVAAGSTVRGEVPDFSVVAGSPAEVVRRYDAEQGWVPPIPGPPVQAPPGWPTS